MSQRWGDTPPPPIVTSSPEPDQASLGDQVWLWVEHCRRESYTSFLAPTDEELAGGDRGGGEAASAQEETKDNLWQAQDCRHHSSPAGYMTS